MGDDVLTKKGTLIISVFILILLAYSYSTALNVNEKFDKTDTKDWSIISVGWSLHNVKLSENEPLWMQWWFWLFVAIAVVITLATRRFLTQRGIRIWALYRQ